MSSFDVDAYVASHAELLHHGPRLHYVHVDGNDFYLTAHPATISSVFRRTGDFVKGRSWDAFRAVFGGSITSVERPDDAWRVDRELLVRFFGAPLSKAYESTVSQTVDVVLAQLNTNANVEIEDTAQFARTYMLDLASRVVFGAPSGPLVESLADVCSSIAGLVGPEFTSTDAHPFSIRARVPGTDACRITEAADALRRGISDLCRRAQCSDMAAQAIEPYALAAARKYDLGGPGWNLLAYEHEVTMAFVAGFESASRLISNVLSVLGSHDECADSLYLELRQASDDGPTALIRCNYLCDVVKETLRLWPITPQMVKDVVAPAGANLEGTHLLPGGRVVALFDRMHRSSEHWSDPDVFQPSRFGQDFSSERSALAFMPFGSGPRTCPGRVAALYETKLLVAHLVLNFKLQSPGPARQSGRMFLTPQGRTPLRLIPRGRPVP